MKIEFTRLEEILKKKCGRGPVYYVPNGGNWGDSIIRYGTLKFLREIGITHKRLPVRKIQWIVPYIKGGTLLYGGGGAWCNLWDQSNRILNNLRKFFDTIIVLPSSFEGHYSIPNTTFFCRDLSESKKNMENAIFCHDLAFYIGKFPPSKGSGTGYFFRTDKESLNTFSIPPENNDLSTQGNHATDIHLFFQEIAKFSAIHTDRLHVAIASCLLQKETHLYPGSYFKNRAVYESSIKENFENTFFHEK